MLTIFNQSYRIKPVANRIKPMESSQRNQANRTIPRPQHQRANGSFYYSGFYSYQDTVYVGKLGNAFVKNYEVAGQTDFFYGFGAYWVTDSLVSIRSCGGGIAAWNASARASNPLRRR
jgi:hypothetical protein